jgi:hypothetical protein
MQSLNIWSHTMCFFSMSKYIGNYAVAFRIRWMFGKCSLDAYSSFYNKEFDPLRERGQKFLDRIRAPKKLFSRNCGLRHLCAHVAGVTTCSRKRARSWCDRGPTTTPPGSASGLSSRNVRKNFRYAIIRDSACFLPSCFCWKLLLNFINVCVTSQLAHR